MSDFNAVDYEVVGSGQDARAWIASSELSEREQELLMSFVDRFSSAQFVRDREGLLEHFERQDEVELPRWLHRFRRTLRFMEPFGQVRFDSFDHYTPRADYVQDIWYTIDLGYMGEGQRSLFVEKGRVYPIGEWEETDRSFLAVKLDEPQDERIFEFSAPDLMDDVLDQRPMDASIQPAFESYASMLSHIIDFKPIE